MKIKDAILDGTYPVTQRAQYITTVPKPDEKFLKNLLATLPEFNKMRDREKRNKWLDEQLESDHYDAWRDNAITLNALLMMQFDKILANHVTYSFRAVVDLPSGEEKVYTYTGRSYENFLMFMRESQVQIENIYKVVECPEVTEF